MTSPGFGLLFLTSVFVCGYARFFSYTPRLEELLGHETPKLANGDTVSLDVLLNQDGDQLAKYSQAFQRLKEINKDAKKLILDGGFFYRFEQFGEKFLEAEVERTVDGIKAIVDAAKQNELEIQSFNVRLQWLMYYTVSHDTYNYPAILKKHFNVTVRPDDYVDFKTVLEYNNTDVTVHAELQFDPRKNRHQPGGRVSENPRKGEVIGERSTTGHGHAFWLEDMAYVLANRAAMPVFPMDFVFFSPLQEFAEEPEVFYRQAVKKLGTLFREKKAVNLYGSAVVKAAENSRLEFLNEFSKVKHNIDAAVKAFEDNNYPILGVSVKLYFQFSDKATADVSSVISKTYGVNVDSQLGQKAILFSYNVSEQPVKVEVHLDIPQDVEDVLDNTKLRQSPLYKVD
ncbi:unnamed protein product [Bursaphelenchus xylophilus]|uniref:(pine wood nematode) hypothetical protein n=1 Tax=Bursaphelenchus xylophilus TaxID=6326 RepID=A0A7I8WN48_BURXY|nr:unnamed protein product [Bursaphelenchus xylophilus]CAG9092771.1 unnamed protein product [Bursaphelenchus xylophilus]